jgi:hypothetical protein
MNRHERRADAAMKRRWKDRQVVMTQSFRDATSGFLYWFEQPDGWTQEDFLRNVADIHGPFRTEAEVDEDQRRVLLPPDCVVTEGGEWNPEWARPAGPNLH